MGLKVTTISRLPLDSKRDYFVYFLDFGWSDPFSEALYANFDRLAMGLAGKRGVVLAGLNRQEFADEVLSWHRVNGESAKDLLPAILVSGCHPAEFAAGNQHGGSWRRVESGVHKYKGAILIPLRDICQTAEDVPVVISRILKSIEDRQEVEGFEFSRVSEGGHNGSEMVILQPNFQGIGVDLREVWRRIVPYFSRSTDGDDS